MVSLVWFRNDLRTRDNPALVAAADSGNEVVAVFLFAPDQWRAHEVADARIALLLRSLESLSKNLEVLGIPLLLRYARTFADAPKAMVRVAQSIGARQVHANTEWPLNERRRDKAVDRALTDEGIEFALHHDGTLMPPGSVRTQADEPYTVFTPFKRRFQSIYSEQQPLKAPRKTATPDGVNASRVPKTLDGISAQRFHELWPGGERAAHSRLKRFVEKRVQAYDAQRDRPDIDGTSTLSPYLSLGVLTARQCLWAIRQVATREGARTWTSELIWRDFYRHIIALFPDVSRGHAFNKDRDIRWRDAPDELDAWAEGRTGYPLVDAAMHQLLNTGWMHNRLRMVSATFLTKHLLIDWRKGERHFMRHLVDGDFAANNGGWQWSASTGTDAAPYFRIFNPVTQARRFDPQGAFVKRWLKPFQALQRADGKPPPKLFEPWRNGGIEGYPQPIVEHGFARQRALDAFS